MLKWLGAAFFSTVFPLLFDFIYDYNLDFTGGTRVAILGAFIFSIISLLGDKKEEEEDKKEKQFPKELYINLSADELSALNEIFLKHEEKFELPKESK